MHVLPAADVYAGGENRPVILVELKLPNIGLRSIESRAALVHAATDVVDELTGPDHLRENTWVNILNVPDSGWGIGGRALTGEQLVTEITGSGRF